MDAKETIDPAPIKGMSFALLFLQTLVQLKETIGFGALVKSCQVRRFPLTKLTFP